MLRIKLAAALSVAVVFLPVLPAWSNEQRPSQYGFPVIPTEDLDMKACYMVTSAGRSLDLGRLCGSVPPASNRGSAAFGSSTFVPASGGASGDGSCQYPWQRDSLGRLCGDRAASRRSGGESSNSGIPLSQPNNSASSDPSGFDCPAGGRDANGFRCIRPSNGEWNETGGSNGTGFGSLSNPTPANSTTGVCNSPDDVDSLGRRCGGRASSVRSGGS